MTNGQRADLLYLLSGINRVMLTSRGCGAGTQLVYRVVDPDNRYVVGLFDKTGRWCEGDPISDDMLLAHARKVVAGLSVYLDNPTTTD